MFARGLLGTLLNLYNIQISVNGYKVKFKIFQGISLLKLSIHGIPFENHKICKNVTSLVINFTLSTSP